MLLELAAENFAVVEKLRLRFHAGFNVLTGETGSGKSLVVDALGLLLGGRASADWIRTGAARAIVSGIFEIPADPALEDVLETAGIQPEDGEILIERELLANGKSRALAGGRPVTAALLREIAPYLGDIHGQHDQQRLFDHAAQLRLLDASAGISTAAVGASFAAWRAVAAQIEDLDRSERERLRLTDLWTMQRKEIEPMELRSGEDAALENERKILKNVSRLTENAQAAFDVLSDSPESASHGVRTALKRLEEAAKIDESLQPLIHMLEPAQIALDEISHDLRRYLGSLESDPARLEEVESRLAQIERLKRKYGATIEEILEFLAEVKQQLAAMESAGTRRAELVAQQDTLEKQYRQAAAQLTRQRAAAARRLEKQVQSELGGLGMAGALFQVRQSEAEPAATGVDAIVFLLSANAGEEPRPLDRVASGGELSRVALALKTIVTGDTQAQTLVFDEVDAGVGGAAGEMVGRRLQQISRSNQVLCVTHLAQIAAFADHHYVVTKTHAAGRTVSEVTELSETARPREIARMLSGQHLSEEALRHAERLIEELGHASSGR